MSYECISEEIEDNTYRFTVTMFKVENAITIFFNRMGNIRLGTLAVAMPHFEGKTVISSILLGDKNMMITKILAEYLAKTFNMIVLVSTYIIDAKENEVSPILLKLTQKLIKKVKEK